jgi:hypothetical protein
MASGGKKLTMGFTLMVLFIVILVIVFTPIFPGVGGQKANGLNYLDNLYNTISKGSAYYIPKAKKDSEAFNGKMVEVTLNLPSEKIAQQAAQLLEAAMTTADVAGKDVKLRGDWGKVLATALADADLMYHNNGVEIKAKYQGLEERAVVYAWWQILKAAEKDLNRQSKFAEAKASVNVQQKAVECAYNYYGVQPQNILDKWGLVAFSLLFYVLYTLGYGFGIMYLFEGMGFKLEH